MMCSGAFIERATRLENALELLTKMKLQNVAVESAIARQRRQTWTGAIQRD